MFNIIKTVLDVIKQYKLKTVCSIVQHNGQDGKSQYSKMVKCIGSGVRLLEFLILIMPFTSNETLSNLNLAVPQFSHL